MNLSDKEQESTIKLSKCCLIGNVREKYQQTTECYSLVRSLIKQWLKVIDNNVMRFGYKKRVRKISSKKEVLGACSRVEDDDVFQEKSVVSSQLSSSTWICTSQNTVRKQNIIVKNSEVR